jgi:enamine deaminase RidA (YjgF/YER057c/UK114 family)
MATKQDIQRVEQGQAQTNTQVATLTRGQAQTNTVLGHTKTLVEAVAAGQKELQETVATRADILEVKAVVVKKIKDHEIRIEELEKDADIPHPHKH